MKNRFLSPVVSRLLFLLPTAISFSVALPSAIAGPIYVYKDRSGVTRFSSKPPPPGVQAKVFTAKKSGFSYYRMSRSGRERLFKTKFSDHIQHASRKFDVKESLIRAVIHVESAFNPKAVSRKGAQGLMQLMPFNSRLHGVSNPFSPRENIQGGVRHLAMLLGKYKGNLRWALAAYNAGEEAVAKYRGIPPYTETQNYVRKVMNLQSRYES